MKLHDTGQEGQEKARKQRNAYLLRTYNITLEEYSQLLDSQGNGCAVCGRPARTRSLHVDHDHKSGEVRGILCWPCNKLLGVARDSAALLRMAAAYLDNPPFVHLFGKRIAPKRKRKRRLKRKDPVR